MPISMSPGALFAKRKLIYKNKKLIKRVIAPNMLLAYMAVVKTVVFPSSANQR
jgi:hypothetical protein